MHSREGAGVPLRVLYRSYGGTNMKGRPEYFDKLRCLISLLRAAERVGAQITFVNNGPVPEHLVRVMRSAGEIVELPGLRMPKSFAAALRHATTAEWPDEELVWYSEDDYLYRPEAFERLVEVAAAMPSVDYFGLYAGTTAHQLEREPLPGDGAPRGWAQSAPVDVNGQAWVQVRNTTASFGARLGALRSDEGIFRLCALPHRNMFRDQDIWRVIQGYAPYTYRSLLRDAVGLRGETPRQRLRESVMAPFRVATNLRAHRRPARRRTLLAADPNLAAHLEMGYIAPGRDWAAVAAQTDEWARERGLTDDQAQIS